MLVKLAAAAFAVSVLAASSALADNVDIDVDSNGGPVTTNVTIEKHYHPEAEPNYDDRPDRRRVRRPIRLVGLCVGEYGSRPLFPYEWQWGLGADCELRDAWGALWEIGEIR